MHVLGLDGEREAQAWVRPGLVWFGSLWEHSGHSQAFAEQSDSYLFFLVWGHIGFNKREKKKRTSSKPSRKQLFVSNIFRTLRKGLLPPGGIMGMMVLVRRHWIFARRSPLTVMANQVAFW